MVLITEPQPAPEIDVPVGTALIIVTFICCMDSINCVYNIIDLFSRGHVSPQSILWCLRCVCRRALIMTKIGSLRVASEKRPISLLVYSTKSARCIQDSRLISFMTKFVRSRTILEDSHFVFAEEKICILPLSTVIARKEHKFYLEVFTLSLVFAQQSRLTLLTLPKRSMLFYITVKF